MDIVDNDIEIKRKKNFAYKSNMEILTKIYKVKEDTKIWENASDYGNGKLEKFTQDRKKLS